MEEGLLIDATSWVGQTSQVAMGRDELNLAEFPLATLTDRVPANRKTLVFEDRIWDKGQRQDVTRRLTISASDKYGLPTATDDEVILGLVQLSKGDNFASRAVFFSRYQLIRLLGWRDEGRNYTRLEESLKRWLGVTLYYENAWWDKQNRKWVDANFHILESVVLHHRQREEKGARRQPQESSLSSFSWNPIVFRSFQAGYLKQIDMGLYRRLNLATAKRMYRFLDKRFHFSNVLQFDLGRFAHEHVGLSRGYDASQLKRRLTPAIRELEDAGFLEPMALGQRFCRLRRGEWQIVLARKPQPKRLWKSRVPVSPLEEELGRRGVTAATAARLTREHSTDSIRGKIEVFDRLVGQRDRRVSKNPPGYLVQSIRQDYQPPVGTRATTTGHIADRGKSIRRSAAEVPRVTCLRDQTGNSEDAKRVQQYLSALPAAELARLEAEALAASPRIQAEGYLRAKSSGNQKLLDEYRRHIVERQVRTILDAGAKVQPACN